MLMLIEPVGYLNSLYMMSFVAMVMTDSGGIPEERAIFGMPCMTLRENTERPVKVTENVNKLIHIIKAPIFTFLMCHC